LTAVLDANVVIKWFVADPLRGAALQARLDWPSPVAPALMTVELANAFRRYVVQREFDRDLARDNIDLVGRMLRLIDHKPYVDEAFSLACERNHSVQDCVYAVMALRMGLPLVTADGKLARKLGDVEGLDIRLIEPRQDRE
jgi:predicted nucleic acid-binding protein